HALALDLDHAGAAIAVRPVARLGRVAQVRDVDAFALGHLPQRLALARGDLAPVEGEGDILRALPLAGDCIERGRVRDAGLTATNIFATIGAFAIVPVSDRRLCIVSHVSPGA